MIAPFYFRICDLIIESNLPLPELPEVAMQTPDCRFEVAWLPPLHVDEVAWFDHWRFPNGEAWLSLGLLGEHYLLRFHSEGDFVVARDTRTIVCRPLPHTTKSTIRHLFIDQVIPLLLTRRERLVIHASAILTPEGVIGFVGTSGHGKSSLAASFAHAGFPLISDDFVVLRRLGGSWVATATYPGVRLWPEATEGLFGVLPESTEIAEYTIKRRVIDPALIPFADASRSVRCFYFLGAAADSALASVSITSITPKQTFMKLLSFAFNLDTADRSSVEWQFYAVKEVMHHIPAFDLHFVREFARLPAVRDVVIAHQREIDACIAY